MDVFNESRLGSCAPFVTVFAVVSCGYVALNIVKFIFWMLRRICCFSVNFKKYGTWAVITGSTDGIGKSFAMQLAEKGMDIVLISRSPQKLANVAEEIRSQHKVRVKTVTADFQRTDIYDAIKEELQGLDIGVLVNNVGTSHLQSPHYYHLMDDYLQFNIGNINVNVVSYVTMTGMVLPWMLDKGKGLIINVGSGFALLEIPFSGVYAATKAFIQHFSLCLQQEYASKGITVQLLAPCIIETNLTKSKSKDMGLEAGLFFPTADRFVRSALQTVQTESNTAGYWPHDLQLFLYKFAPPWWLRKVFLDIVQRMHSEDKDKTD